MPRLAAVLLGLVVAAVWTPAVDAHSTYEAAELELHVINDEGSDTIEAYGGYDIQEAFVGFSHDPLVGAGADGDGFYVRLELYGDRKESTVPQAQANWSVEVRMRAGEAELVRHLWTVDGKSFQHDFDSLLLEVEERDTHVQRAFVAYGRNGLAPGLNLSIESVASRVDGDLRDVAPGGIPVPATNGRQEYQDPNAIKGRGLLMPFVALAGPGAYLRVEASALSPGRYAVSAATALVNGSQHILVRPVSGLEGHELEGSLSAEVKPGGTLAFSVVRTANATEALVLDILTDVGGRARITVDEGGLALPDGEMVPALVPPPEKSPGPAAALVAVVALAAAASRRRGAGPKP